MWTAASLLQTQWFEAWAGVKVMTEHKLPLFSLVIILDLGFLVSGHAPVKYS